MPNQSKEGENDEEFYPFVKSNSPDECPEIRLTPQEMAVLRECRTNSLYLRGLPLGIFSVVATRYLAHTAFSMGVVVGVSSYKDICFEKIMSLKDSRLADQVRSFQQRASGGNWQEELKRTVETYQAQQGELNRRNGHDETASDRRRAHHFGRYKHKNAHPDVDDDGDNAEMEQTSGSSYDKLRRSNRARRTQGPNRLPKTQRNEESMEPEESSTYDPDVSYDKRETYPSSDVSWDTDFQKQSYGEGAEDVPKQGQWPKKANVERVRKNKYGDEME
eukprot:gene7420-8240_t